MATATLLIFSLTLPLDYMALTKNDPPAVQFFKWANSLPLTDVEFYCGDSERLFDRYPVKQRVKNVASIDKLQLGVKTSWLKPSEMYVCYDIPGFNSAGNLIGTFSARKGASVDRILKLYKNDSNS